MWVILRSVRESSALQRPLPVVAIVGGGASGTLTAVHLLRHAQAYGRSLRVVLIDRDGRHGLGQAYATADPRHLLNTRAVKMSGLDGDPDHLVRWARAEGLDVTGADFIPRGVYGRYLCDLLREAVAYADGPLTEVTGTVTAVTRPGLDLPLRIHLSNGGRIDADVAVVATGNRAPASWPRPEAEHRYIADPWATGALERVGDGAPVLVVGTGLTMVDVAVTLTRANPDTVVYALSRHGLLPREHRCPASPQVDVSVPGGAVRLGELLRIVRAAVDENDGDWQGVVDGLRQYVPRLWAQLTVADRRRFLNPVARYWEIHRHRIPPATAALIADLKSSGRLQVLRGRLVSTTGDDDELTARIDRDGVTRDLRIGWLINSTGASTEVTDDPLLRCLITSGIARPDPLRLGVEADETGALLDAAGHPQDRIFTLGPPLRGMRYETTSIPEIRAQAAVLAPRILQAISADSRESFPPVTDSAELTGRPLVRS